MANHQSLGLRCRHFLLDCKQPLTLTIARYEDGILVPLFLLVQEPSPILKYSYESNPIAFALIKKENIERSFEMPSPPQSPEVSNKFITIATPISFRFPTDDEMESAYSHEWNLGTTIEDIPSKPTEIGKLTKFDRQRGWYIIDMDREKCTRKDMFYIHLQSKLKLRSMVEVYYFIETGRRPTQGDTNAVIAEMNSTDGCSDKKTTRGEDLIEMREAGHYDEEEKKIYRSPIMPIKQQTTSRNAKKGYKIRKKERIPVQEVGGFEDSNSSMNSRKLHILYDCQTLV